MLVYRRVIPYNITPQEWLGTHEGAAKSIPSLDTPACPCVRILPHCWKTWSWLVECWAASSPRQKSWAVRMLGRFYIHLFERHRQSFHAYRTRTQRHTKKHHTHTHIYIYIYHTHTLIYIYMYINDLSIYLFIYIYYAYIQTYRHTYIHR